MNNPTRVAAFVAGLVAVFAAATGIGTLTGPVGAPSSAATAGTDRPATEQAPAEHAPTEHAPSEPDRTDSGAPPAELPGGLMVSQDGYTLDLARTSLPAAPVAALRFQILDRDGHPVTSYTTGHGKDLHLIAVRRDLTRFQHVHPKLGGDGTWSVPLDLSEAGVYRVFADFTPSGREDNLTLGSDLTVAGRYSPQPLPPTTRTAEVDGYTVTLEGDLVAGQESRLTLSVSQDGAPVTDLQPYLEAYGHLVALRDRDLAYLHVHPAGSPGDGSTEPGPGITFYATAPSAGAYRLFLDFRHDDRVRTADFTLTAGAEHGGRVPADADHPADTPAPKPSASGSGDGHGHGG